MKQRAFLLATLLAALAALLLAACGGGAEPTPATPTRAAPTSTPAPAPTGAPAPTATPRPAPTVPPAPPTAAPRRGGILQVPVLGAEPYGYDMYESGSVSAAGHEVWQAMVNNLIWVAPYGDGHTLGGDAAQRWDVSQDGKTVTFFLHRTIKFHDGVPLTSKDVVYNFERAKTPRSSKMNYFKAPMEVLERVEALDDYTVRVVLKTPSNAFFQIVAMNQFAMYPAHLALPENEEAFKKQPIGSGPFKIKSIQPQVRIDYVRNDEYWKPGLPYLDAIVMFPMTPEVIITSFRTGRLHATNFNSNELTPTLVKTLEREQQFVALRVGQGPAMLHLNNRPPWNNPKVREALSLAMDRQAALKTWREDVGSAYSSPMLMPELGGKWGISVEVMKKRPGFRDDKREDIARAKQLIKESGIDPGSFTAVIASSNTWPPYGAVVEAAVRELGFKTDFRQGTGVEITELTRRGAFDVHNITSSITFDDPNNYLKLWVVTGGGSNWGKWSEPRIDLLFDEQDRTLDQTRRRQMILEIQNIILDEHYGAFIPVLQREAFVGHLPAVKNYPPKLPFNHSSRFRWEEVWLDR